jgi:membrane fusion protein, heavy metal efflux system
MDSASSTPSATANNSASVRVRRWSRAVFIILGSVSLAALAATVVLVEKLNRPEEKKAEEKSEAEAYREIIFSDEKQKAAQVEIAEVLLAPLTQITWRTGRLALNEDRIAHLCPPTEGIIAEVPVRIGQTVEAGKTLAVIDSREFGFLKLELVKARTLLESEKENHQRVKTTTQNATELLKLLTAEMPLIQVEKQMTDKPIGEWRSQLMGAYSRRNQLKLQLSSQRNSAGAISETVIRKTESDLESAEATYIGLLEELRYQVRYQARQSEQKLREAQTAADIYRAKLLTFGITSEVLDKIDPIAEASKTSLLELKAPFSGTIVEKHAVLSERVGPTFQMFVLADLSQLWIQADLYEADLPLLASLGNRPIRFRSAIAGISERQAEVISTGDLVDKTSRSLTLTAVVKNPDRTLKAGTFVEVGFDTGMSDPVLQIPLNAVMRFENKPFVFVATNQTTFVRREVQLGRESGNVVEILSGLKTGEKIVTQGGFVLKSELLKDQMAGE